jgi:hypothetical protein
MSRVDTPLGSGVTEGARRASGFAKVGFCLSCAWFPIDVRAGSNLGQLGVISKFLLVPAGLFGGAHALGLVRQGFSGGRLLARWTMSGGAAGTLFAFWLLATR